MQGTGMKLDHLTPTKRKDIIVKNARWHQADVSYYQYTYNYDKFFKEVGMAVPNSIQTRVAMIEVQGHPYLPHPFIKVIRKTIVIDWQTKLQNKQMQVNRKTFQNI